ncbi:hypothetical protein BDV93DRAFT_563642 [Ceratobasidium sp. AG-I]|nr:hypothetical protein BDV93DRAFT_563642 [Ceratobasidium sp. AG-I]
MLSLFSSSPPYPPPRIVTSTPAPAPTPTPNLSLARTIALTANVATKNHTKSNFYQVLKRQLNTKQDRFYPNRLATDQIFHLLTSLLPISTDTPQFNNNQ